VFQSYALWPHMTVFDNVAFGLQTQGAGKADLEERVKTALEYMQLQGMEGRYPQEMSGASNSVWPLPGCSSPDLPSFSWTNPSPTWMRS